MNPNSPYSPNPYPRWPTPPSQPSYPGQRPPYPSQYFRPSVPYSPQTPATPAAGMPPGSMQPTAASQQYYGAPSPQMPYQSQYPPRWPQYYRPVPSASGIVPGMLPAQQAAAYQFAEAPSRRVPLRTLLRTGIVVLGLAFVVGLALLLFKNSGQGPKRYAINNLVNVKKAGYSFSYPKSWQNGANLDDVKQFTSQFNDTANTTAFVEGKTQDKYGRDQPKYAAIMTASTKGGGITDSQIRQYTATPALKAQFERGLNTSFTADSLKSDGDCASIENYQRDISYFDAFPLEIRVQGDCALSAADQKDENTTSIHIMLAIGIEQSNTHYLMIQAKQQSWLLNKTVYQKMFTDFKAN